MSSGVDGLPIPGELPADGDGPVFDAPWQAQAFSLVVNLHKAGLFEWKTWAEIFSAEIAAAPARPDESVNDAYYRQWVAAMERLLASLGLVAEDDVADRAQQWNQAYLNTPHGQPVSLNHASCPPAHEHKHEAKREPVTVVPAASA